MLACPLFAQTAPAPEERGLAIYRLQCLSCHGDDGQGGVEYDEPLAGSLGILELAELIQETMPEDAPGTLTDQQADDVARYVFHSFYSSAAREKFAPPRIELSRLTAEQYRQAIIDIGEGFSRQRLPVPTPGGLKARYVQARHPHDKENIKGQRLDPQIDFDFGTETPLPEIDDPGRFAILWSGSVLAPETGRYLFQVHSPQAVRLYVNSRQPRIEAWVKSAGEDRHVAEVFLVGGRWYPLLLEFAKSKQGVDDSEKQKEKPPVQPASIALRWKRPHGVPEVIPARFLSPQQSQVRLVCSTPFPPEDQSYGWIRSSTVSPEWDRATTSAALQVASQVLEQLEQMLPERDEAGQDSQPLRQFAMDFACRAFRLIQPDSRLTDLVNRVFDTADDPQQAVKQVLLYTLKSPRFLYREVQASTQANVPERLSFAIWNSIPDVELLQAGNAGSLNGDALTQQIQRLTRDGRARQRLREFLLTWLQVDAQHNMNKDPARYPGFDAVAINDMRTSLELQIADIVDSGDASYRRLLTDEKVYLNRRLADLFDDPPPVGSGFEKSRLDPQVRAGVLTHPYLLARFAYRAESSPIHRGVFVARHVLGSRLHPPPEAVAPLSPRLQPDLTTRQRVTLQTQPAQCMSCHRTINSLGFAFENFDAVGRYRDEDRGQPIDSRVVLQHAGQTVELENARQLAELIVDDPQSQAAFCVQLFHFLAGQSANAWGDDIPERLRRSFVHNQFNIRLLAEEILLVLASAGPAAPVSRQAAGDTAGSPESPEKLP
jgi:hypothetical protein